MSTMSIGPLQQALSTYHNHGGAKQTDSPPSSPDCDSSAPPSFSDKNCFSCQSNSPSGAAVRGDITVAKEAVCLMGLPDHLVQLAIDVQRLDHGTDFIDATQLYLAAEDICNSPAKQAELTMKLHVAERAEKERAQRKAIDAAPTVSKIPESRDSEVRSAGEEPAMLSAEMPQAAGSERASEVRVKMVERVQMLAKENEKLKQRKMCRSCKKVELTTSGVTFLPCGHFITCEACSETFDDCPACGKNIMGTVRTFLS